MVKMVLLDFIIIIISINYNYCFLSLDIKMDEEVDISDLATPTGITMKFLSPKGGLDYPSIDSGQVRRRLEEDPMYPFYSICTLNISFSLWN